MRGSSLLNGLAAGIAAPLHILVVGVFGYDALGVWLKPTPWAVRIADVFVFTCIWVTLRALFLWARNLREALRGPSGAASDRLRS